MSQQAADAINDAGEPAPPPSALGDPLAMERYAIGEWLWLLVCTAVGGALRVLNLAGRPLWADELTTIITAGRPLSESFTTEQDPQPPLYQLLVRLFSGNFAGSATPTANMPSEAVLRAPAALFGTLTIAAAWWCARHFLGRVGAAVIALLVAVNPLLVHHARDARPYSLFVFFACLVVAFGYRLAKTGRTRDIVGYALATAGMFLSHYYAMFFVAAQLAYFSLDFIFGGPTRRNRWRVLTGLVLAFVLSLPPLLLFAKLVLAGMQGSWWISKPSGPMEGLDALGDMLGVRAIGVLCLIPLIAAFWFPRPPAGAPSRQGGAAPSSPATSGRAKQSDEAGSLEQPDGTMTAGPAPAFRHGAPPNHHPRFSRAYFVAWWLGKERAIYLALFVGFALFLPLIVSILLKPAWVMRYSLPVAIPMLILGLAYLRSAGPCVTLMVLIPLLAMSAPKAVRETKGDQGLREAVAVVLKHKAEADTVFLPDWRFARDFIHPEGLGLPYYGYAGPYASTSVEHFYAAIYGSSKKLTKDEVAAIVANPRALLPAGRTWAICFHSTAKPVREFLIKRGRLFQEWEFGLYIDGRTPMYTLMRIEPEGVRPSP